MPYIERLACFSPGQEFDAYKLAKDMITPYKGHLPARLEELGIVTVKKKQAYIFNGPRPITRADVERIYEYCKEKSDEAKFRYKEKIKASAPEVEEQEGVNGTKVETLFPYPPPLPEGTAATTAKPDLFTPPPIYDKDIQGATRQRLSTLLKVIAVLKGHGLPEGKAAEIAADLASQDLV